MSIFWVHLFSLFSHTCLVNKARSWNLIDIKGENNLRWFTVILSLKQFLCSWRMFKESSWYGKQGLTCITSLCLSLSWNFTRQKYYTFSIVFINAWEIKFCRKHLFKKKWKLPKRFIIPRKWLYSTDKWLKYYELWFYTFIFYLLELT